MLSTLGLPQPILAEITWEGRDLKWGPLPQRPNVAQRLMGMSISVSLPSVLRASASHTHPAGGQTPRASSAAGMPGFAAPPCRGGKKSFRGRWGC